MMRSRWRGNIQTMTQLERFWPLLVVLFCLFLDPIEAFHRETRRIADYDEYAVPLEQFQIVYTTNGSNRTRFAKVTEHQILEATRSHLMSGLGQDADFVRLTLVHIVRSDRVPWLRNGTKIAFGGFAYYRDTGKTRKDMLMEEYLCFVGKNVTKYVSRLQKLGWESLEYAWLMSPSGNMMEYDDGEMTEMGTMDEEEDDVPAGSESMDSEMSMTMYLVAILVPIGVCVCMCLYWAMYRVCHDVKWDNEDKDPNNPMWQQHHPQTKAFREYSLRISHGAEKDDDASDVTFEHASSVGPVVDLNVEKSNPAAQLWRQRQAEV